MKQGGQGLQDYYLNQLRKEKILATVFLTIRTSKSSIVHWFW